MSYKIRYLCSMMLLSMALTSYAQTTINFTVNQPPLPEAGFRFELQPDLLTFKFTDSSFTDIVSRKWIFGDGDSVTGNNIFVQHTYAVPGTYEACLEVVDTNGCTDLLCKQISHFTGIKDNGFDLNRFVVSPNPYQGNAVITYQLPKASRVVLELYDIVGAKVQTLFNGRQSAGEQRIALGAHEATDKAGIFFLRLTIDGQSYIRKVVELH